MREIDFGPFYAVARMLYEGAWLAERVAAVGGRLAEAPQTLHPTTRAILTPGLKLSAVDAFEGIYRLKALRRDCEAILAEVDALCVPTIPCFVTLAEIAADPIGPNARLGTYTNFVNLLDLCGIAVPTGERADGRPGSVTLLAPAGRDALCASLAARLEAGRMGATDWARPAMPDLPLAAGAGEIALAVCGAHMSGLPLNRELTGRGARLIRACRTAPAYRLVRTGRRSAGAARSRQANGRRGDPARSMGAARRAVRRFHRGRAVAALHRHGGVGRRHDGEGLPVRGAWAGRRDRHHRAWRLACLSGAQANVGDGGGRHDHDSIVDVSPLALGDEAGIQRVASESARPAAMSASSTWWAIRSRLR